MTEMSAPVASAVVIPDQTPPTSPPFKRRRSSTADSTFKRPRLSEDAPSPLAVKAESPSATSGLHADRAKQLERGQDRRKSSVQEEKKRGQRLFGGLLSTLSQSTPVGQQKRRLEIEKRQQEKAKQQKIEDENRRAEKLANLATVRRSEHVKYQEQAMKTRHTNTLAMAHFLPTKTQPKIYYKPWELLPADEQRIKQQITDTEELIRKEVEEFNAQHPHLAEERKNEETTNRTSKETVGESHTESPTVSTHIDSTNSPSQVPLSTEKRSHEEHNGEVVVENEEDTVIY